MVRVTHTGKQDGAYHTEPSFSVVSLRKMDVKQLGDVVAQVSHFLAVLISS